MSATKKQKMTDKVICTHNGTFHCDEALACFMLKQLPQFKDHTIQRSRDAAVHEKADVLVDVGGIYDFEKLRFDHHQRTFDGTLSGDHNTKLSSAGLVYKHYGRDIIKNFLQCDDDVAEVVYHKIYKGFIECIDAVDNGVEPFEGAPKYVHNTTSLSSRVGKMNPNWRAESQDTDPIFPKAMEMCGREFLLELEILRDSWLPAREIVVAALAQRKQVHPSGEIMELPFSCPWKGHLYDLEKAEGVEIKYVLYGEGKDTTRTRVQCVSVRPDAFENRLSLPAAWRGLRDGELDKVSGIPGGIFVHAGGFIGGHTTRDGALAMAAAGLLEK